MSHFTQIKQEWNSVISKLAVTEEYPFQIPDELEVITQDMVNDKSFFEKIKQLMVEESLRNTDILEEKLPAMKTLMTEIFNELMREYSIEECLRLFGYFFCGVHLKNDYPTMIHMSDAFVCVFYKFYKEDPTSDFVFGAQSFTYSPEVVKLGLLVSLEFAQDEIERIGGMINDTMQIILDNNKRQPDGKEYDWAATTIAADVPHRSADQFIYFVFMMGRTTLFNQDKTISSFLSVIQLQWDNYCKLLAETNKPYLEDDRLFIRDGSSEN